MTKAMRSAIYLQGYFAGMILCGQPVPQSLKPSVNVAQAVLLGLDGITPEDVLYLVPELIAAMIADSERIEAEAWAVSTQGERN